MSGRMSQGESIHENETTKNSGMDDCASTSYKSILARVKSGVASILPNRISEWFSNSANSRNDSSLNASLTIKTAVKRRRLCSEVDEEDDNEDVNENLQSKYGKFTEHNRFHRQDSHNNEAKAHSCVPVRRDMNFLSTTTVQACAKRSRLDINSSSPLIAHHHQSIVASTPTEYRSNCRSSNIGAVSRSPYQRYGHLKLCGYQSRKEPPYDFMASKTNLKTNIVDLITNSIDLENDASSIKSHIMHSSRISSRKILNLPTTSSNAERERYFATTSHLKRQSLSSVSTDTKIGEIRHFSTTIHENLKTTNTQKQVEDINQSRKYNKRSGEKENHGEISQLNVKRRKLGNGSRGGMTANESLLQDTGSESGESGIIDASSRVMADKEGREYDQTYQQRKAGLYNTTLVSRSCQGSRASSSENGLNFYSHLEGKKSLFAETSAQTSVSGNMLNPATLSLNSMNRRQFNASIYGSTSTLSDSRLLNTFSPFYKGKTTYGGAAAYSGGNYTSAGVGAVHIAPTLIRPNSSLTNLSSSNNSLSATGHLDDNSTISGTVKRIFDLINDFRTPLSEAKKMANSFRTSTPHLAGRLNENELNASRAIRIHRVRSPYTKPCNAVLFPHVKVRSIGSLPPVKELQVPSMQKQQATGFTQNESSVSTIMIPTVSEPILTTTPNSKCTTNCIFSSPTTVEATSTTSIRTIKSKHFKQSRKTQNYSRSLDHTIGTQLKSGSVLEALSKEPLVLVKSKEQASNTTTSGNTLNSFGSQFKMTVNEWECNVCKARNKSQAVKCVTCKSAKKIEGQETSPDNNTNNLLLSSSAFGSQFRKKAEEWECDVNVSSSGSVASTSTFKFGFTAEKSVNINHTTAITTISKTTMSAAIDSGFKLLTAQHTVSKWECEVCMAKNDVGRIKCVCCEQHKPESTFTDASNNNIQKFTFGTNASKFSFGFSSTANISKNGSESKLVATELSTNDAIAAKPALTTTEFETESSSSTAKVFKLDATSNGNNNKDACDGTNKMYQGYMPTSTTTTGFILKKKKETKSCTSDTPITISIDEQLPSPPIILRASLPVSSTPSVKFNLGNSTKTVSSTENSFSSNAETSLIAGTPQNTFIRSLTMAPPLTTSASAIDKIQPKSNEKILSSTTWSTNKNSFDDYKFGNFAAATFATALPSLAANDTTAKTIANKPMFSSDSANICSVVTSSSNSFGDLNFSSSVQANNVGKFLQATTTTATIASKTFTIPSNTKNIFGSFDSNSIVSSSINSSINNPIASTSQFGMFNKTSANTGNMFGSFGDTQTLAKPENMFGITTTNTDFTFGASATTAASTLGTFSSARTSISTTKTDATAPMTCESWSNSFALNKPSTFTFGLSNNDKASTTSIFGTATSNTETKVPGFGGVNVNASVANSPISIFDINPASPSINIFGPVPSESTATPTLAFGTSPFGDAPSSSLNTMSTFDSTAAASSNKDFGGFRAVTAPIANTALEVKKPDFAFWAPSAQNSSGSLSFVSAPTNTVKPAFNFASTPTQRPVYNFVGSSESAPNTPLQFNAGSTPFSSNIFAPIPSSRAQSTQKARRKIRLPVRRIKPW